MNVEDWEAAALHEIVERIAAEAEARGAEVVGSELVGLMPAGAAAAAAGAMLRIDGFDPSHVLELRLLESLIGDASSERDRRAAPRSPPPRRPPARTTTAKSGDDEDQPGRVRAAVGERDQPEHAAEDVVGHLLLRRRVEQHDRRALADAGARTRRRPRAASEPPSAIRPYAGQVDRPREQARARLAADRRRARAATPLAIEPTA